jgi:hypothetical protein
MGFRARHGRLDTSTGMTTAVGGDEGLELANTQERLGPRGDGLAGFACLGTG